MEINVIIFIIAGISAGGINLMPKKLRWSRHLAISTSKILIFCFFIRDLKKFLMRA